MNTIRPTVTGMGRTGLGEWRAGPTVATSTVTNGSQLVCLSDGHIPEERLADNHAGKAMPLPDGRGTVRASDRITQDRIDV